VNPICRPTDRRSAAARVGRRLQPLVRRQSCHCLAREVEQGG
jgi:hypothetical protein